MPNSYYSRNFILNNTDRSQISMYLFLHDHWFKLGNAPVDPDFTEIKTRTEPVYLDYNNAYVESSIAQNHSKAATASVSDLFKLLGKDKINSFDFELQGFYPKESDVYKAIFANGHKPFYSGVYEMRLEALDTLYRMLLTYPDLVPLVQKVEDFKNEIDDKWEDHQKKLDSLKTASEKLEEKRISAATEVYGNIAKLMFKYRSDPSRLESYFDFNIIRQKPSPEANVYIDFIPAGATRNLVHRQFTDSSRILLENSGQTDLNFGLVPTETTSCVDTGIILGPGEKKSVWASELGDLIYTYLNVTNLYGVKEGHYSVSDFG